MSVKIVIHPNLLDDGATQEARVSVSGETVGDCLEAAAAQIPEFTSASYLKNGELMGHVLIYINREDAYPDELLRPVKDGDTIELIPVIGGG